MLLLKCTWCHW